MPMSMYECMCRKMYREEHRQRVAEERESWRRQKKVVREGVRLPPRRLASKTGRR